MLGFTSILLALHRTSVASTSYYTLIGVTFHGHDPPQQDGPAKCYILQQHFSAFLEILVVRNEHSDPAAL